MEWDLALAHGVIGIIAVVLCAITVLVMLLCPRPQQWISAALLCTFFIALGYLILAL